ncbi:hypothetical protein PS662_03148 [Pseudomonas fluorescens]|uniref:Glycosyltransferase RgtA/B/C/D-like domain-containing protein n=2 Tax=Pseudomonas fluorescens TaxID=294 RepID=A0A5E6TUR2_PSEFL|nr:hypothetical protein PS662_03148 [Pseudomonas fluorescens]
MPSWVSSTYSPIDEFYYTTQAFDIVEGMHEPNGKLLSSQYSAYNITEQLTTAASVYTFGDNYFGLRIPSVLAGLIVLVLFYLLVLNRFGLAYATSFSLILMSEKSFVLATRIAEPTIFRMAAAAAIIFILAKQDYTQKNQLRVIGFVTCFAWLFIYPTNAFLGLFVLITLATSNPKNLAPSLGHYLTGCLLCVVVYLISYYSLGNTFSDVLTTKSIFSARVLSETEPSFIAQINSKLMGLTLASYFISYPYVMWMSIFSLIVMTILVPIRNKLVTRTDKVIYIFCVCFLLQCAFINDYPERKLVFLLPICLYMGLFTLYIILRLLPAKIALILGATVVTAVIATITPLTFNTIYKNPQYTYKNAMKELSYLDNQRVIGGWSYGFRLYNNYKPYLNRYTIIYSEPERYYQMLNDAGKQGNARFTIEYGNDKTEQKMNSIDFHKYKPAFKSNDPSYPDVYVYKFIEKQNFSTTN